MINISQIKVRYAETDQMGVVYYSNYFIWMEVGRTNLLRDYGLTYKNLEESGIMLPVVEAYAKYIAPAYYDDDIYIHSKVTGLTNVKIKIDYEIYRNKNELVCKGYTVHAFVSVENKKIIKVPKSFQEKIIVYNN